MTAPLHPAGVLRVKRYGGGRRWYIRAVAGPSHASYSIIDLMDAAAKGRPFSSDVAASPEPQASDYAPLYFPASSPAGSAYSKSGRFVGRDAVVPNSPMISMPVRG
jgi:hypothetical protein